jgi:hypothetical protein
MIWSKLPCKDEVIMNSRQQVLILSRMKRRLLRRTEWTYGITHFTLHMSFSLWMHGIMEQHSSSLSHFRICEKLRWSFFEESFWLLLRQTTRFPVLCAFRPFKEHTVQENEVRFVNDKLPFEFVDKAPVQEQLFQPNFFILLWIPVLVIIFQVSL